MADQLLYAWADRGLQGRGRLQVVASTRSLYLEDPDGLEHALALCRYERPRGTDVDDAPVSFGWLDIQGRRFAFCRMYAGNDAFGRPGAFTAHVLVGDSRELPAEDLLATMGSANWWTGGPSAPGPDGWLPPARLADFTPAGLTSTPPPPFPTTALPEDDAALAVTIAALAHRGAPVLLAVPPTELTAALRQAEHCLPGLLTGLSISTYESAATRSWFSLTGSGDCQAVAPAITVRQLLTEPSLVQHRTAATLALAGGSAARAARTAWTSARGWQGRQQRDYFLRVCAVQHTLRQGRVPTTAELLPALRRADTATDVLDHVASRKVVGAALARRDSQILQALNLTGADLPTDTWDALGAEAARSLDPAASAVTTAAQVLTGLSRVGFARFTDVMWQAAKRDPTVVVGWPAELIAAACTQIALAPAPQATTDALMAAAVPHIALLASDLTVPDTVIGRVLAHGLSTGTTTERDAGDLLLRHPFVVRHVERLLDTSTLSSVLQSLPHVDDALALHAGLSTGGDPSRYLDVTAVLMRRVPPPAWWQLLRHARGRLPDRPPERWLPLVHAAVTECVRDRLRDPGLPLVTDDLAQLFTAHGPVARDPVGNVLRRLVSLDRAPNARWLGDIAAQIGLAPAPIADDLARYVLDYIVGRSQDVGLIRTSWSALTPALNEDPSDSARVILLAAERSLRIDGAAQPGRAVLHFMAELVSHEVVARKRWSRGLTHEATQQATCDLVRLLAERDDDVEPLRVQLLQSYPPARSWLKSLAW